MYSLYIFSETCVLKHFGILLGSKSDKKGPTGTESNGDRWPLSRADTNGLLEPCNSDDVEQLPSFRLVSDCVNKYIKTIMKNRLCTNINTITDAGVVH